MNAQISHTQLVREFFKIGILSFGGPAAQIALMHKVLVDERKWLTENDYLNALGFCMLLPGPEAMQLATYAGWRLRGIVGGLIAGILFVLPGAIVIFALASLYVSLGHVPWIKTLFLGVQTAAIVIVVEALVRVSRKALVTVAHWLIAGAAFIAIFFFQVPFPMIVLLAGLYGAASVRNAVRKPIPTSPRHQFRKTAGTVVIGVFLWFAPLFFLDQAFDTQLLSAIGVFFSKLAVVTFGGAYAVLAYMVQAVVVDLGWLTATQMMDGLGLAETTPGPLILVTQFVAFLAGYDAGGFGMAIAAAMIALWATFVPCFIWIFAGAPYIERISAQPRLAGALNSITAAVVGVILNLSLWFALHVIFAEVSPASYRYASFAVPDWQTVRVTAVVLTSISAFLLLRLRLGVSWVLLASAASASMIHASFG